MKPFRIAVIGAGETGTPLLAALLSAPYVELVGVAELDHATAGVQMALAHGVYVTRDFTELARRGDDIDILIDVTGVPSVRETLRRLMRETGNDHTLIMHERIALLLMSLGCGRLADSRHELVGYA
ncbi:oxidoreductase [Crenobacter sp. SG2303]|uniref:Oxidoreductase n=1 Tax=Crenobacter oryzisoli TaxID=3056844 RepID=A0ABT7XKY9_9NEIS|nr:MULTISPECIES: oxidoreductase [unclassified Crenobacter]MDN0074462.1 oxidoreductase [Crenobacter sp. SG2303]MDN0081281.1 oxidoreductase [Crenobacter sp. SG2305]